MNGYKTDVAVLILFFNRPDHLSKVFEEVKKARPSQLFLYQDGPRGERDMEGIEGCRTIVSDENIDWECNVHRLYQDRNYGCDPSEYISQKWAFSVVDKCIVLEDDDVPSQSFFPFCKEMLDKYEDDPRVWMVSGFNSEDITPPKGEDYFFTDVFSIWGWASWRRVLDTWDETYSWMDDSEKMAKVQEVIKKKKLRSDIIRMCQDHKASGKAYYETIFWASMLLNDGVAIMPVKNQINNIGVSDNSTHFQGSLRTMPHKLRHQFTMPRYEMEFPLHHPESVEVFKPYKEAVYRRNAWGHPFIKVCYSLEELFLNLRYFHLGVIIKAVRNRLNIWLGRNRHK